MAVGQLQLAQDVGRVGLDGLDRDEQLRRDLLVRVAAREQPQHLALARRQLVDLLVDGRRDRGVAEGVEHEPGQPRAEHDVAVGDAGIAAARSSAEMVLVT